MNSNGIQMDAVVIAGGVPQPGEPLYPYTQGRPKAMLDISGKPMAQWVIDALSRASSVKRLVIVGLESSSGLESPKLIGEIANQGSMLHNIRSGVQYFLEKGDCTGHVALVSSDIPAVLPEHVDWVIREASQTDLDLYYNVISREVMERRFPASKRTYTRLRDIEVCGGDLNVIRASVVNENQAIWEQIIAGRKNPLKQAALIGYGTLLLLLLRRLTIHGAVDRVTRRLGMTGQALICPFAEIGMDVDKPNQLETMRQDLSGR